jgi:hypothetical protein
MLEILKNAQSPSAISLPFPERDNTELLGCRSPDHCLHAFTYTEGSLTWLLARAHGFDWLKETFGDVDVARFVAALSGGK